MQLVPLRRVFGSKHGARVTARHVVAQVHGGGEVAPGSVFRRDDDPAFLNLLVGGLFGYS
jgi:hypothetical protein